MGEKKKKRGIRSRGLKRKGKGPMCEVEGLDHEKQKTEEGGCKMQGVGKQNSQGETLGFGVRWAWAGLGYSLAILKTFIIFFFCKIILANNFEKRRRPSR